jgi:diguanylate cyclase (GGDEF)-like protein
MIFSLLESVLNYDLALLHYHDQTHGKRLLSCHIPEDRLVSQEQVDRALQAYGQTLGEGFEGVDYEHECIGPLSPEAGDSPFKTVFAHRFTHHNEPIGGLMFCAKDEIRYETLFPTDWVLQELKVLMKLRHQYSLADFRAVADSQTNTYNYHYFIQALSNELKKASRFGLQVSVALIQLEEGGTESLQENPLLEVKALQAIVQQARDTFRSIDLIARYGPQTIAVLMPGTTQEQAVQPCRRLQENLQQNPLSWQGQPFSPQTRISIMSRQEEMSDPAALLHQENALILRSSSPQG